jgi:hypothetical protein
MNEGKFPFYIDIEKLKIWNENHFPSAVFLIAARNASAAGSMIFIAKPSGPLLDAFNYLGKRKFSAFTKNDLDGLVPGFNQWSSRRKKKGFKASGIFRVPV